MSRAYIYVVDRDFGFAPNPFHGFCTLATCKPGIRKSASVGDWIIGVGGGRLNATGHCIYAMRVTSKITFDEYWSNPKYSDKKPVRNGSSRMLVGDNIYRLVDSDWKQADSHHSYDDGSTNMRNLKNDTKSPYVLISHHFYYFGRSAPEVPEEILTAMGYKNGRNYRLFEEVQFAPLLAWLRISFNDSLNTVADDPYDFSGSQLRYTGIGSNLS